MAWDDTQTGSDNITHTEWNNMVTDQKTRITVASPSQGDVLYYNGSAWAKLAAGTSGHVLKTQGAGANPQWAAESGGSPEGTAVLSTGETGGTKFLREDGDNSCSWQADTLAAIGSTAQGDVLYHNGSAWTRLAAGTSGHFLKTNGAGANPAWAAGGGASAFGDLLVEGSVSAASSWTETGLTAHDYYTIMFFYNDFSNSGGNVFVELQMGDGSIDTGNNYDVHLLNNSTSTYTAGQNHIEVGSAINQQSCAGVVIIAGVAGDTSPGGCTVNIACGADVNGDIFLGGLYKPGVNGQIDQIKMQCQSGNFTGWYKIYGKSE